jgi:hypothetical protein
MFANRLRLLGLCLLVALAVYSTPVYHQVQANSSDTLALSSPQLCSLPDLSSSNARATTLERVDQLRGRDLQVFMKDDDAEVFWPIGGAPNREALRQYAQLSELSKAHRKASFNLMTAEDKSSLWRVHLCLNLARHQEWTEKQRSIVLEAITLATPALYKVVKDSTSIRLGDEPVRSLTQRALLVFSKQEAAALFSELGFNEQSKSNHAGPPTVGSCSCSQESDYCSHYCSGTSCTVLTWACGTFGLYPCDGICSVPSSPTPTPTLTPTPTRTTPTPRTKKETGNH